MADAPTHEIVRQLAAFLEEIDAMVLASVDEAGLPYACNLYMAYDRHFNLYFASEAQSAHAQHIETRPTVSVAGHAPIHMWQQVRGIQLRGQCFAVPEADRERAWQIYYRRFPHVTEISEHLRAMTFYRVEPTHLRWIDNSVHFGYKVDIDFPLPEAVKLGEDELAV
jgi:uncharacterized protein YhbP (UPF0306 family)